MAVLGERDRQAIGQLFAQAAQPVEVRVVLPGEPDPAGRTGVRAALAELSEMVPLITVREFGGEDGGAFVERVPGVALFRPDGTDLRVRFAGLPNGYEFQSLVQAIADAATGDSGLAPSSRQALGQLAADVHILVFSTPT